MESREREEKESNHNCNEVTGPYIVNVRHDIGMRVENSGNISIYPTNHDQQKGQNRNNRLHS